MNKIMVMQAGLLLALTSLAASFRRIPCRKQQCEPLMGSNARGGENTLMPKAVIWRRRLSYLMMDVGVSVAGLCAGSAILLYQIVPAMELGMGALLGLAIM